MTSVASPETGCKFPLGAKVSRSGRRIAGGFRCSASVYTGKVLRYHGDRRCQWRICLFHQNICTRPCRDSRFNLKRMGSATFTCHWYGSYWKCLVKVFSSDWNDSFRIKRDGWNDPRHDTIRSMGPIDNKFLIWGRLGAHHCFIAYSRGHVKSPSFLVSEYIFDIKSTSESDS